MQPPIPHSWLRKYLIRSALLLLAVAFGFALWRRHSLWAAPPLLAAGLLMLYELKRIIEHYTGYNRLLALELVSDSFAAGASIIVHDLLSFLGRAGLRLAVLVLTLPAAVLGWNLA
jgi:hypothetical protein